MCAANMSSTAPNGMPPTPLKMAATSAAMEEEDDSRLTPDLAHAVDTSDIYKVDMSFLPDLSVATKLPSPIMEAGNYFIMDSEQLVSNPFAELQQEAVAQQQAEAQSKRNSMTEKLTSVKNNVCENHFQMARSRLEREKTSRLKQLHDHANKLRHEVKLLDLDKQRRQVEIKRRLEPSRDHSYDEAQVSNTERRLGANIASFYLDKRLKYPVRIRSVSDISLTPTVQRARATLRQSEQQQRMDEGGTTANHSNQQRHSRQFTNSTTASRAQTAKSTSTTSNTPPRSILLRRRDSRSAPLYARTARQSSAGMLPAIDQRNARGVAAPTPPRSAVVAGAGARRTGEGRNGEQHQQSPAVVKFAFENPLKILASNEESAKMFHRSSAAYYPGATRAIHLHGNSDTSDDDADDDPNLPDRIDLRAMFFSKDGQPGDSFNSSNPMGSGFTSASESRSVSLSAPGPGMSPYHLAMLRKAQAPPPRLTTDMMQVEMDKINGKVKSFMNSLVVNAAPPTTRKFSLIEELYYAEEEEVRPRFTSQGTNTAAPVIQQNNDTHQDVSVNDSDDHNQANSEPHTPPKYSYKLIRGRDPKVGGSAEKAQSEDLVLQALTGVPMGDLMRTHVPLHSASRALRHTSTYKMHKVVERLIQERTKYQRHQVDELKRQMSIDAGGTTSNTESQAGQANNSDGLANNRVSRVSISS